MRRPLTLRNRPASDPTDTVPFTRGIDSPIRFEVNLIPHTLSVTTLKALAPGAPVNLEVDLIARYVEWMLGASQGVR